MLQNFDCEFYLSKIKIICLFILINILKNKKGHVGSVNAVVCLSEYQIISASSDKTIKIWDMKKDASTITLTGHEHFVLGLELFTMF